QQDAQTAREQLAQIIQRLEQMTSQVEGEQRQEVTMLRDQLVEADTALAGEDIDAAMIVLADIEKDSERRTAMFEADVSAQVAVDVPEPNVSVEQADPQVTVQQARPEVSVDPGRPQVTVNQAAPQVRVQMPQPTITIDMPRPEILVEMPDPDVAVSMAQPRVSVQQAQPSVSIEQGEPQVRIGEDTANVGSGEQPTVSVQEGDPQVQVQQAEAARISVSESQPQVAYNAAEPEVQIESAGEPKVQFNQSGEAKVQIRQLSADETRQMAEQQRQAGSEAEPRPGAEAEPNQQNAAVDRTPVTELEPREGADRAINAGATSGYAMTVGEIVNYDIMGANGETLGDIEDIVNVQDRLYAVVGSGGFLGMGEKEVAIPLSSLVLRDNMLIAPNISENQIEALEEFNADSYEGLPEATQVTLGGM
ncbi:MAG TPA: PRC-barrel domain-containing protein, partial [Aurantimonas sp.]